MSLIKLTFVILGGYLMQAQKQSLIYLHLSVLLFGGTGLFAQIINLSALDITVYRTAIAGAFLVLLLKLQNKKIRLEQQRDYGIAILLGVIMGIHWITYFSSIQMAGVAMGMIALFTYPVITVFIEPFFYHRRPHIKDIIGALIVLLGIYLLLPSADLNNDVTLGIVVGIVSACFIAARNIIHKRFFSHYGGPHTMLYQTLVASIMLCAFVDIPPLQVDSFNWILLVVAGVIFTATPHSLFAASLQHLSAATAGLIACLQPLYGTVLAFLILHEQPSLTTLIGGSLVISAAFYETYSVTRKNNND